MVDRRLAAILAADIVGYSRLMAADQESTLRLLRDLRRNRFDPRVKDYRGTVIKRLGDGWIVEFPAISDAVSCAIAIQEGLGEAGDVQLRMGIHIGEVTFEAEDVFGDGVNIAARLEALAEPEQVHFAHRRYDDATRVLMGEALLNSLAHAVVVASYAHAGRMDEARRALNSFVACRHAELTSRDMGISEDTVSALARGFRDMWRRPEDWAHLADGLALAGLLD